MMTTRRRSRVASLLAAILLSGCSAGTPVEVIPEKPIEQKPTIDHIPYYLEQVIARIEHNSVNRLKVNWPKLRAEVLELAKSALYVEELNPAILHALTVVDDRHSSFNTKSGARLAYRPVLCDATPVDSVTALPPRIGYLKVPSFGGTDSAATALVTALQNALRQQDRDDLFGWIIDLRRNTGGNMWPMVAALGPITGDSALMYFIDPEGWTQPITYRNGVVYLNTDIYASTSTPYVARNKNPRIAVLTDNMTASGGEAAAITLKARDNTRFFGTATCGQTSSNRAYIQNDGATLVLAYASMADRAQHKYAGPLVPDETITDPTRLVQRAIEWLQNPQ